MKIISIDLTKQMLDEVMLHRPIRKRLDIIKIILKSASYLMCKISFPSNSIVGTMVLYVNEMSRLIFYEESSKKYYSIIFPFTLIDEGDNNYSLMFNTIKLDDKKIGLLLEILDEFCIDFELTYKETIDFITPFDDDDYFFDGDECLKDDIWNIFKGLLFVDDGYVRYDWDETEERVDPKKHPVHHLDVNYTNATTYKLGLQKHISPQDFIDILDNTCIRKYLV